MKAFTYIVAKKEERFAAKQKISHIKRAAARFWQLPRSKFLLLFEAKAL
ncbi:MAG: hypothetical protein NC203_02705 [Firmicutes bacterium]|nr:hypothetical protein [Bacillota bacterium]